MHFYVSLQHHKRGLPVVYQGAVRVPQGYSLQDCRRIKVMIGVLMLDATGEADGCNHQISEQRWLVMPHGIQLVIRIKSLRKTGFLNIPSSPRTETKHICHLFMGTLFIENSYIQNIKIKHSAYWQVLQHLLSSCWVPSAYHSIKSVAFFAFQLPRLLPK